MIPSAPPSSSSARPFALHPLLVGLVAAAALVPVASTIGVGVAAAADPEGSGSDCVVSGKGVVEKGVFIYNADKDGTPIAGFATQEVFLTVSDFPADPSAGRAKVKTGKGSGSIRIEGWLEPTKIPLAAKQDVTVVPEHVWIGRGEAVKLKGASPGKLHVQTTITATQQTLKGKATCSQLAVGPVKTDEPELPKDAKKWVLKSSSLDLFAEANGSSSIFTIEVPNAGAGVLLFSTETKGAWVRVQHRGSLTVDAWAKMGDLKAFPKGEMLDALTTNSMVSISPAKLKVEGSTKLVIVDKDVPLRLTANDAVKPIGTIESGAEVVVVDTVAGWSRIYPKGLEVIPPDGKDFWAKAKDLGL